MTSKDHPGKKIRKDEDIRAFGVWSERTDIKNGLVSVQPSNMTFPE